MTRKEAIEKLLQAESEATCSPHVVVSTNLLHAIVDVLRELEPPQNQGILLGDQLHLLAKFVLSRSNIIPFLYCYAAEFDKLHDQIPGGAEMAALWAKHLRNACREMQKELLPKFSSPIQES